MTTAGVPGQRRAPRGVRGMTLIEVVVAMAVLSLIVLVLGASLRGMAQSAQRIDERVDVVDEMRVAVAFLREVFARLPETPGAKPTPAPRFAATASEVSWVAVMPARFGAAGRHHFRLAVEPAADGTPALVLRYTPWRGDVAAPDWAQADARVLARRVERLALSYGGTGMQSAWQPAWAQGEHPPARLRIDLATASMAWPPLVVPVHDLSAAPGAGRFVVGGSQ
jgi:general secretion pathway protein J